MIEPSTTPDWWVLRCDAAECGASLRVGQPTKDMAMLHLKAFAFEEGWALDQPGFPHVANHYCPDHINLVKEER